MLKKYIQDYVKRRQYSKDGRKPFFELAAKYLPKDQDDIIVDIGCGNAEFANDFDLDKKYKNLFLLESNQKTIEYLKKIYSNVLEYIAPQTLPFDDDTVSFVHLSHLVEHLYPQDIYKLFKDIDRILKKDGIIVISTPLMWDRFFDDLSHVKPYNPQVFINYLASKTPERSRGAISSSYDVMELIYRYKSMPIDVGWSSKYLFIDVILQILKRIISLLGFRYQIKNGYTLVLKK